VSLGARDERDLPPALTRKYYPGAHQVDTDAYGCPLYLAPPLPEDDPPLELAKPLRERVLTSAQIKALPPPQPLLGDLLFRDSTAILWGRWGIGKSFVSLDMALSVRNGVPWLGHQVQAGPVLYVVAEGVSGVGQRVRSWEGWHEREDAGVLWLPEPVDLLSRLAVAEVAALCDDVRPVLVVLDTLNRCLPGADENASAVMSTAVASMDALRIASGGACVLAIHHPTKDGETARGHGALYGALTTELKLSGGGGMLSLEVRKQKDAAEANPIGMRLEAWNASAVVTPVVGQVASPVLERIWNTFGADEVSKTDLLDAIDMSKTSWFRESKPLLDDGSLVREQRGRSTFYRLSDDTAESMRSTRSNAFQDQDDNAFHVSRGFRPGTRNGSRPNGGPWLVSGEPRSDDLERS
jgi:hypothetical protein